MRKFLAFFLIWLLATAATYAQNAITLPIPAAAVADVGNGPIKLRVTQGNASIFTSQGSGTGSTVGTSTSLTLTATPATAPIVGGLISGSGIAAGTTVTAYNGVTNITLSAAMAVPAGSAVAWGAACPASAAGIPSQFIPASVMADYYLLYTEARVCAISPGGPANTLLILPVFYESTTPSSGSSVVTSIFGRTGVVVAALGDYTIGQVTNGLSNSLTSAFFFVGSAGNLAVGVAMSGDCTLTNAGVVICTKTNGVSFAPSATTDTTNATNIASGTLNTLRLPSPFTSGTASGTTTKFMTGSGAFTSSHLAAFDVNGNIIDGGAAGAGSVTSITIAAATAINLSGTCTVTTSGTCTVGADVGSNANAWGATASKLIDAATLNGAATPITLTDAATIAVDMSTFIDATVTLGGNRTLGNPTNVPAGRTGCIYVLQPSAGGPWTLAYSGNWKFPGGTAPTLSTGASAVDVLCYKARSPTFIWSSGLNKALQ